MAQRSIPWEAVKRDYMQSDPRPSYRQLADKYGCSEGAIRKRAGAEHWQDTRAAIIADAQARAAESETERRAREYQEWDSRHLDGARALYYSTTAELTKLLEAQQQGQPIPAYEFNQLAQTLDRIVNIERKVNGRDVTKIEHSGALDTVSTGELRNIVTRLKGIDLNELGEA